MWVAAPQQVTWVRQGHTTSSPSPGNKGPGGQTFGIEVLLHPDPAKLQPKEVTSEDDKANEQTIVLDVTARVMEDRQ
jgi:hypothetical protein